MAKFRTDQIRNIAVLGHSSSGKTTLTEALLYKTGVISRMGTVEDGTTVSDWDDEEKKRGISIHMSVIPVEFENYKLNFLDTPGYLDFMGEIISALHISEAALLLVDAVSGAEVGTELAWDRVSEAGQPTVIFVNKMDRENASFDKAVDSLRESFGDANIVPFQLPIGEAEDFSGIVSLIDMKAYMGAVGKKGEIPANMMDAVETGRRNLMETAAESDDELIMKYLEGEELTPDEMRRGLLQGVQSRGIIPVYCGSTTGDVGLSNLARALTRYVPNPAERTLDAAQGDAEVEITGDPNGATEAAIFKTTIDRYVGRMSYTRVFSVTLNKDDNLSITRTGDSNRIANLFSACGKDLTNADALVAGDIGVISKVDALETGDTLSATGTQIPAAEYPRPLYGVAVVPATKADSAKMGQSLNALTEEDSTLVIESIRATKQTVLQGMGGTHVDVAVARLESMFGVKVDTSIPKVPYQETIIGKGSAQYRHKKQSGGAGQFAEVHMRVEPTERGEGFSYVSEIFGGSISQVFLPSIEKGIRQVMDLGVIAGFPVVDIKAAVYDGKEHPVDSKDIAFQTAGREAFKQAVQEAKPVLLEPIYAIRVVVPEEYMGDIMGDFSTRRGTVQGMEQQNNRSVVRALVPQAEILRYDTDLRSMTQGRGIYSIEFDHYEPVPRALMDEVIAQHKLEEEAE